MTSKEIADLRQEAQQTFEKDLPQLWTERPNQWVAYRGSQQLGFAKQPHELFQDCFRQGFKQEEFVVFCVEAQEDEIILGPLLFD